MSLMMRLLLWLQVHIKETNITLPVSTITGVVLALVFVQRHPLDFVQRIVVLVVFEVAAGRPLFPRLDDLFFRRVAMHMTAIPYKNVELLCIFGSFSEDFGGKIVLAGVTENFCTGSVFRFC